MKEEKRERKHIDFTSLGREAMMAEIIMERNSQMLVLSDEIKRLQAALDSANEQIAELESRQIGGVE